VAVLSAPSDEEHWAAWEKRLEQFHDLTAEGKRVANHRRAKEIADRHLNKYAARDSSLIRSVQACWEPEDAQKDLTALWLTVHHALIEALETAQ